MTNSSSAKSGCFFYGWAIVAISTLSLLISNGLAIGGLPIFYKPIQQDLLALGAVTAETKDAVTGLGAGLTFLLSGIFSLVTGIFIDRVGSRKFMIAGSVVLGTGLVVYSTASSPAAVYLSHSLLGLSLGLAGVMIQTVLISNWFRRRRGLAMGIVLTGTSLGGAVIPLIAAPMISAFGWRAALQNLSLLAWLVLLPASVFFVKDRAADAKLNFDGDQAASGSERTANTNGSTFREAVGSAVFWTIALCAALIFYPIFAVSQQFNLYLQNTIGVSREYAAAVQSVLFATSIAGKFLFGLLCDRFPTRSVIIVCCGVMFTATLMLTGFIAPATIYVFLIPFALGYGGTFVLIQLITVEMFGLRDIGKILGALTLVETFGGFAGSVITGRLAALGRGDYTTAFYGVTVAAGLAFAATIALFVLTPRPERERRQ